MRVAILTAISMIAFAANPVFAPPLTAAILRAIAGVSWGAYSPVGRGSQSPLIDTAGNVMRRMPVGIVLVIATLGIVGGIALALAASEWTRSAARYPRSGQRTK